METFVEANVFMQNFTESQHALDFNGAALKGLC